MKVSLRFMMGLSAAALVACGAAEDQVVKESTPTPAPTSGPTLALPTSATPTPPPAASGSAAPEAPPPKLDLSQAVGTFLAGSVVAWSSKDPKRHTALYTPDGVIGIPGAKGWEEVKAPEMEASLSGYFAAFPDLKVTYTRVLGKGNVAAAEWVFTGTNEGELMGQKPTKKKTGYRALSLLTFAPDGKVKRESSYFDMGTMMGQLGLGPKGAPVRAAEAAPTSPPELFLAKESDDAAEAVARNWLMAGVKGDTKALLALATDDIVVSNQYMPTDTKGKKALEKEMAEGSKAFVDQKTEIAVCVPAGGWVACEYTWTATWKGPAMGMKPTGKTGTVHSAELIQVKDGKVARTFAFANGAEFASTFGISDGAPPADAKKPAPAKTK